jgi:hypothetical protein
MPISSAGILSVKEGSLLETRLQDIATALGDSRLDANGCVDLGILATSPNLNTYAKYIPIRRPNENSNFLAKVTDDERKAMNYGRTMYACTRSQLWNVVNRSDNWARNGISIARDLDFDGYYHAAPTSIIHQVVGKSFSMNPVFGDASNMNFYAFNRSGRYKDRAVNELNGMGSSSRGQTDAQLNACICAEDLTWRGYGAGGTTARTLYGADNCYFGIALFTQSGTFVKAMRCKSPLSITTSVEDFEMYMLNLSSISLDAGEYKAVACAIINGTQSGELGGGLGDLGSEESFGEVTSDAIFLPLQPTSSYPTIFNFSSSGLDLFTWTTAGVKNDLGRYDYTLTTSDWSVVVWLQVKNNTNRTLSYNEWHSAFKKWNIKTTIVGEIMDDTFTTTTINATRTSSIYTGLMSDLTIGAGQSVYIPFLVPKIWSNSSSSLEKSLVSGQVMLSSKLYFGNAEMGDTSQSSINSRIITISYGLDGGL